jgi:V/A-type H+-transporting ATPase subunit D
MARALMSSELLEEAIAYPKEHITVDISTKNIMSVNVPEMEFKRALGDDEGSIILMVLLILLQN